MKCIGQKRVEYTGYALVDHHVPYIPERVIQFVAKEMGKHIFLKLLEELKQFESTVWGKELR